MYKMMTPGPTQVSDAVLDARSLRFKQPDCDPSFVEDYKQLCLDISRLLHTDHETFILGGEGILGLEAACASLIEPGDHVLVLDNGIFGRGFADFVEMYGGVVTFYSTDYREAIDVEAFTAFLKDNHDFKIATVVHGDTPSGILNDVDAITRELKAYGILTIVDAVSTLFGEPLSLEHIDVLCGGSQKVISAPPGLTLNVISEDARAAINNRKTPIAAFYANLKVFFNYYEEKWFPYTMPASDINGLRAAIDAIAVDPGIFDRHRRIGEATRAAVEAAGLSLYLKNGFSNTVTAFEVPSETTADAILSTMLKDHNILITGSFGVFAGKLIRLGHMGNNANENDMTAVLSALDATLRKLGVPLKADLAEVFHQSLVQQGLI
ncbi:MAG: alanine--glyoxylate aminotransferase family protein [Lachnospiraceae bacterium]|nr:alanine--glyoxylate aminotransferase family protein [Lachnospiraceae bacterium]